MKLSVRLLFIVLLIPFWGNSQDLISADELSSKLQDVVVLDVRPPEKYETGHIFQAKNIWRPQYENQDYAYGGMMPTERQFCARLTELNIDANDQIVVYDDKGGCDAARIWWIFDILSHGAYHPMILDGGLSAWGDRNSLISPWLPDTIQREPFVLPISEGIAYTGSATMEEVKVAMDDSSYILLDTRSWEEYVGDVQKDGAYRKGRIPGAVFYDWTNAVNYDGDEKLKSVAELEQGFKDIGVTKDKKIITYCQSGVRSAHTTFVLSQVLGYAHVANYDGSWIEWSYHEDNPIDTGDPIESEAHADQGPQSYGDAFFNAMSGFWGYFLNEVTFKTSPWYVNYFWLLIVLSLVVWGLEIAFPWRKEQSIIRKDFWLDGFYMFFNFYVFGLMISGFYAIIEVFAANMGYTTDSIALINIGNMPAWLGLLIFFILNDFVQWFTHVLLHRYQFLWRFHKVHHSVEQMGFAAHLRYHWMENIFYKPLKTLVVLILVGGEPADAFIVHYIAIAIGHINHANIGIDYGPFKYVLNNPKMHIWHHAHELPEDRPYGMNFGISLSTWDYIFRTNYIPESGRDIKLGFPGLSKFPKSFFGQLVYGFRGKKDDATD